MAPKDTHMMVFETFLCGSDGTRMIVVREGIFVVFELHICTDQTLM
jgi:hypothetical protein